MKVVCHTLHMLIYFILNIEIFDLFFQRMWNRSVNSEAVLRLAGKAPPGNGSSGGGSLVAGPGGRGGGRGSLRGTRGGVAGGGIPFHYSRTLSYDESAGDGSSCPDGPPPFQRNLRSFERSQVIY